MIRLPIFSVFIPAFGRQFSGSSITAFTAKACDIPVHVLARKILTKAEAFSQATGARLRQWYADALESLGPDASTEQPEDLAISHALPGV